MSAGPIVHEELIERFRRDGFVVVPDLLTDAELEKFGAAVDRAVAERKRGDDRVLAEKSLYEQSFTQCMNLWEDNPEVLPLTIPRDARGALRPLVHQPAGSSEACRPESGVRPGPRLRTGTAMGPRRTPEPSGRVAETGRPGLGLVVWKKDRSVVVSVTGEVDIATTPQITELGAALRLGARGLVCDLTGVSILDAAGLMALLLARRRNAATPRATPGSPSPARSHCPARSSR